MLFSYRNKENLCGFVDLYINFLYLCIYFIYLSIHLSYICINRGVLCGGRAGRMRTLGQLLIILSGTCPLKG
jgi:hypothetical protein